jgi:hypothetical protein
VFLFLHKRKSAQTEVFATNLRVRGQSICQHNRITQSRDSSRVCKKCALEIILGRASTRIADADVYSIVRPASMKNQANPLITVTIAAKSKA